MSLAGFLTAAAFQAEKTLVPWLGKEKGSERERTRGKDPTEHGFISTLDLPITAVYVTLDLPSYPLKKER